MMAFLLGIEALLAQGSRTESSGARLPMLIKDYEAAVQEWSDRFDRFNVEERRASAIDLERRYLAWPGWTFTPRFLKLAEEHREDPAAVDALLHIVTEIGRAVSPNDKELLPYYTRALELLIRDHLDDERLVRAVQALGKFRSLSAEQFLRAVLERRRDREVRGIACMNLAACLATKRELVLRHWPDDDKKSPFQAFLVGRWDPGVVRQVRESDPQALSDEAQELYERAIKEYGDIEWWKDPDRTDRRETIADAARMQLNKARLSIGVMAPEVEGQDVDGLSMKLSDHRGKVVVLSFWGSWCGPCMAAIPRERSLVGRLAGRRFILLGVNGDEDRGHAKEVIQEHGMTWRSWWDGKPPGPIATRWGVRGWPMLYVIDPGGVIRYKADGYDEKIDQVVDSLLGGIDKPQ